MIQTVKTTKAREVTRAVTRSGDTVPGLARVAYGAIAVDTVLSEGSDRKVTTIPLMNIVEHIIDDAVRGVFQSLDVDAVEVEVGRGVQSMKVADTNENQKKRVGMSLGAP